MKKNKKIVLFLLAAALAAVFAAIRIGPAPQASTAEDYQLSSLTLAGGSTTNVLALSPAFSAEQTEYTAVMGETAAATLYITAEAPTGSSIAVSYTNVKTGAQMSSALASGTRKTLSNALQLGENTFTVTVAPPADSAHAAGSYTVTIMVFPSLKSLSAVSGEETLVLEPAFHAGCTDYTIYYPKGQAVTLTAPPTKTDRTVSAGGTAFAPADGYSVTYAEPPADVAVAVSSGDFQQTYHIRLQAAEAVSAVFQAEPTDCTIAVYDGNGKPISASREAPGTFENLLAGAQYHYVATKYGYVSQTGSFRAGAADPIALRLDTAPAGTLPHYTAQWWNFRNSETNMAITSAHTPVTAESAVLKWAQKYGSGWSSAPVPPIIVNNYIYTANNTRVLKLNLQTGALEQEGTLAGSVGFALNNLVYAEGMLFALIGNGQVQALHAQTLESLWISEPLGGQTLCPLTYRDGYIYTGTWNSETAEGTFFCLSVTDEDPGSPSETKYCTWKFDSLGGFYWAGAYAAEQYVVFGSDDGKAEGNYAEGSRLTSVHPVTGAVIDQLTALQGDIRSCVAFSDGYLYFTSKGGRLYQVKINADGTFDRSISEKGYRYVDLGGMSTGTPVVYKNRIYTGVSGPSQFSGEGHFIKVIDARTMQEIYAVPTKGYVQTSMLLSNAYEDRTGKVYIYATYNAKPGGITVLEDSAGQTEPKYWELYTPESPYDEYCICSLICDETGTIYYKNDSCYMMAVAYNPAYLTDLKISGGEADLKPEFLSGRMTYEVTVNPGTASVRVAAAGSGVITVNGQPLSEADGNIITLKDGRADIEILVTTDEMHRSYYVSVREKTQNAALKALDANESNAFGSSLTPDDFSPEHFFYETKEGSSSRAFINIWPLAADSNAAVRVYAVSGVRNTEAGAEIGITSYNQNRARYAIYFAEGQSSAVIRIAVTAEDGVTVSQYQLTVNKKDVIVPVLSDGAGRRTGVYQAEISFTSSEAAAYYFAAVPRGADAPELNTSGTGTACAAGQNVFSADLLTAGAFDVYIAVKDRGGNLSSVIMAEIPAADAAEVAAEITSAELPAAGAASLQLPAVPEGYTIAIASSTGLISADGTIAWPKETTEVTLIFTVTRESDGTTAQTAPISLTLRGTHQTYTNESGVILEAPWTEVPEGGAWIMELLGGEDRLFQTLQANLAHSCSGFTAYLLDLRIDGTSAALGSPAVVRLPIPEMFEAADIQVAACAADGTLSWIDCWVEDGYAVFETDQLGVYAVVHRYEIPATAGPAAAALLLCVLLPAACLSVRRMKAKENF